MIWSARQAIHPPHGADESKGKTLFSRSPKEKETAFEPIILQAAQRYDIDAAMIKAIIMAESNFNPKAVSNKGAKGLMQLMPGTAEYLGVEDSFDPTHNIEGGVRYFKILLDRFQDDIKLALAAYNAGSRNVRKYGGVPPFRATQSYIDKVLKYYADFNAV
jgi:soluble lytic murein transglycosylase-like protein